MHLKNFYLCSSLALFVAILLVVSRQSNVHASSYDCLPFVEKGVRIPINEKGQKLHIVQPGESLLSIANQHCVTLYHLVNVNLLTAESILRPDMTLLVPQQQTIGKWEDGALGHLTLDPNDFPEGMDVNLRTQIIWPSTIRHLTQSYHAAHRGIDFALLSGEPVSAVANGEVLHVIEDHHIYGKAVVLDHGNHILSLYAHLSEMYVREGFVILQGEVIGASGNTGKSTGAHLHFEIRHKGNLLDPCEHLPGGCRFQSQIQSDGGFFTR